MKCLCKEIYKAAINNDITALKKLFEEHNITFHEFTCRITGRSLKDNMNSRPNDEIKQFLLIEYEKILFKN